jgi:hypothetical protein
MYLLWVRPSDNLSLYCKIVTKKLHFFSCKALYTKSEKATESLDRQYFLHDNESCIGYEMDILHIQGDKTHMHIGRWNLTHTKIYKTKSIQETGK